MADSNGGISRLDVSMGEDGKDPLHSIARRLMPLVRDHRAWWVDAVRRWASDSPRHYVQPESGPTIKTREMMEGLKELSKRRARRGKYDTDDARREYLEATKRSRERAKQELAVAEPLADGASICDDGDYEILPVPFPENLTSDEQIAILALIHDAYVTDVARIAPWPSRFPPQKESAAAMPDNAELAHLYAYLLRDRVPRLREHWDTHEAAIEKFLADAKRRLAENAPPSGKSNRRGRPKANYEIQQREEKLVDDWNQARSAGVYKADFANQRGLTPKDFEKVLGRVRKNKSRAD